MPGSQVAGSSHGSESRVSDEAEQRAQRSQLTTTRIGKRSYRKVCKVALAQGVALYKGKLLTAQALGAYEEQFDPPSKQVKQSYLLRSQATDLKWRFCLGTQGQSQVEFGMNYWQFWTPLNIIALR